MPFVIALSFASLSFGVQQRPFPPAQSSPNMAAPNQANADDEQQEAENQLQTGIALTKRGRFQEAIPHFLKARGRVVETFALDFNLALCYVGMRQYLLAIQELSNIHAGKQQRAEVENLLAQAYIGNHQQREALDAVNKAATISPHNEKLYLFVSDGCFEQGYYDLGIQITNLGLQNLPKSSRLLYQRGLFRMRLEEIEPANQDFELARHISPDSDIGYIAAVQEALSSGNIAGAIRTAREGIGKGHHHFMLLTMLGEALLRSGATPASLAEFSEAQGSLERAVSERPGYSSAQIALGKLYLLQRRVEEAIAHLDLGRQLDPYNPAAYTNLAEAYRINGNREKARQMLTVLAELNRQQAARISSASGGHSGIAAGPVAHP